MSELRTTMIEHLEQGRKQEWLTLCRDNYQLAIEIVQERAPELRAMTSDPFDGLYGRAMEAKEDGDTAREMQVLDMAIKQDSMMPGPYERLAILYSKQRDHEQAYRVCAKWFDSGHWKLPQAATTSLRLLDRLEKLGGRLGKI